jgi:hypothetical protein
MGVCTRYQKIRGVLSEIWPRPGQLEPRPAPDNQARVDSGFSTSSNTGGVTTYRPPGLRIATILAPFTPLDCRTECQSTAAPLRCGRHGAYTWSGTGRSEEPVSLLTPYLSSRRPDSRRRRRSPGTSF